MKADAIDRARFSRVECERTLTEAFQAKLGNAEDPQTQLIMEHLTDFCGYGAHISDPNLLPVYTHRVQVLMEIKKFLNCEKTFEIEPDEVNKDENQGE